MNDVDAAAAKRAAVSLEGAAIAADVSDPAQVRQMFEQVARSHGHLDVLVNMSP
ncbi:MAG TPA: SDR family oxidoreductase [Candidatus Limnocylindria bacterium]|nr:SDR family oxidoreductase [Candidatus Limnocylindria bacterium]